MRAGGEAGHGDRAPEDFTLITSLLARILEIANKGLSIQRYKGLGEMNASELWETTLDPSTRILRRVDLEDAQRADELFSILMGDDVSARRSFITRRAKDVRFLDI